MQVTTTFRRMESSQLVLQHAPERLSKVNWRALPVAPAVLLPRNAAAEMSAAALLKVDDPVIQVSLVGNQAWHRSEIGMVAKVSVTSAEKP